MRVQGALPWMSDVTIAEMSRWLKERNWNLTP
jgi:hypothetical protein